VKKFKSGIVHEYLFCEVGKAIGRLGSRWRLRRNTSIARDQGLQPDMLVLAPDGERFVVEVCCSSVGYDAENVIAEAAIAGVDKLIVVTPDKGTRDAVKKALQKHAAFEGARQRAPIEVFDSGECLRKDFDWAGRLSKPLV